MRNVSLVCLPTQLVSFNHRQREFQICQKLLLETLWFATSNVIFMFATWPVLEILELNHVRFAIRERVFWSNSTRERDFPCSEVTCQNRGQVPGDQKKAGKLISLVPKELF